MAKYKPVEQGQGLFITLYPDMQFEDHSLEKVINRFIDEEISMDIFDDAYANDRGGQHAIHPKSLLKVVCYAFSHGVTSSRTIEKLMSCHVAYIYLSGGRTFDHSTICEFFHRHGNAISNCFSLLVHMLGDLDMLDLSLIAADGTIVSANADRSRNVSPATFAQMQRRCAKYAEKLVDRARWICDTTEEDDPERHDELRKIDRQQKKYQVTLSKLKEYQEKDMPHAKTQTVRTNLTDPDSALLKDSHGTGGYSQGYMAEAVYSNNDYCLAIEPAQKSEQEIIGDHIAACDPLIKQYHPASKPPPRFCLDGGYFSISRVLPILRERDLYIPIPSRVKLNHTLERRSDGRYCYIPAIDEWVKGRLNAHKKRPDGSSIRAYRFNYRHPDGRAASVSIYQEVAENMDIWHDHAKKMESEAGKHIYHKRFGKEHNHHTLKEQGGMRRVWRRGIESVTSEITMHGIAFNVKKIAIRLQGAPPLPNKKKHASLRRHIQAALGAPPAPHAGAA